MPTLAELIVSGQVSYWMLSKHGAVASVLRDPRFSVDVANWEAAGLLDPPTGPLAEMEEKIFRNWMLNKDAPDHTRIRTLVNKAFTARRVEKLRPHIEEVVGELLDAVDGRGEIDVIADLAYPLPATIICELLGVPVAEREVFKGWARDLAPVLDLTSTSEEIKAKMEAAAPPFLAYMRELIERRRQTPGEDLITALIAARDAEDRLSDDELLAACALVLGAGFETTMNLIGNGTYLLLKHPEQLQRLIDDPSLITSAIEEFLRVEGPVQLTTRIALDDVEVDGTYISARQQGLVMLAAANRDPDVFPSPHELDIARTPNPHLTFGGGAHFCPGAALARLEGAIAIGSLVRRYPNIALKAEPPWRETTVLHGLKELRVSI